MRIDTRVQVRIKHSAFDRRYSYHYVICGNHAFVKRNNHVVFRPDRRVHSLQISEYADVMLPSALLLVYKLLDTRRQLVGKPYHYSRHTVALIIPFTCFALTVVRIIGLTKHKKLFVRLASDIVY